MSFDDWKKEKLNSYLKTTVWRKSFNEGKKKDFYYNKSTKQSQWNVPEEIAEYILTLPSQYEQFLASNAIIAPVAAPVVSHNANSEGSAEKAPIRKRPRLESSFDDSPASPVKTLAPVVVEVDPEQLRREKEEAEARRVQQLQQEEEALAAEKKRLLGLLAQKDSILEPQAVQTVKALVHTHKEPPGAIVKSLSDSYHGYPKMSRVVLEWLQLAQRLDPAAARAAAAAQGSAEVLSGEALVLEQVARLLKQRFNRPFADELVLRLTSTPPWLLDLLQDSVFSAALKELHERHPGSSFLSLCMKEAQRLDAEKR